MLLLLLAVAQSPLEALASEDPAVAARAMDALHRRGDDARALLADALPSLSGAAADRARAVLDLLDWARPAPRVTLRFTEAAPPEVVARLSEAAGEPIRLLRGGRYGQPTDPLTLEIDDLPLPAALLAIATQTSLRPFRAPDSWSLAEVWGRLPSWPWFCAGAYAAAIESLSWNWEADLRSAPRETLRFDFLLLLPAESGHTCRLDFPGFEWVELRDQTGRALAESRADDSEGSISDPEEPAAGIPPGWGCVGGSEFAMVGDTWNVRPDSERIHARGWITFTTRAAVRSVDLPLAEGARAPRDDYEVTGVRGGPGFPTVHLQTARAGADHLHFALGEEADALRWPGLVRVNEAEGAYRISFNDAGDSRFLRVYEMGPPVRRRLYVEFRGVEIPR